MATCFLSETELLGLLRKPSKGGAWLPIRTAKLPWLDLVETVAELSVEPLSAPRPAQSFKGLFLPASQSVGQYGEHSATATTTETAGLTLIGVRACELRARTYMDRVMQEGDFQDPAYAARSEGTTIVSCDCVDCTESCCCTLVGGKPFPEEGYDVNLTPLEGGFLVEAATDRGRKWLDKAGKPLPEAAPEQLTRRDEQRREMTRRLEEQNRRFGFSATDTQPPKLPLDGDGAWQKFAADCVECGACTNICPTCHCFYLYDQVLGPEQFERLRTWDSCLFATYHRMAGGTGMKPTPRPLLLSRLANRVLHKFVYSPQQYGVLGCVGCGRCIDACIGDIDIRQVVAELRQ